MALHFGIGNGRIVFVSHGCQQLLVGVLRCAFELDGLGNKLLRGGGRSGGEEENGGQEQKRRAVHDRARVAKRRVAREGKSLQARRLKGAAAAPLVKLPAN